MRNNKRRGTDYDIKKSLQEVQLLIRSETNEREF